MIHISPSLLHRLHRGIRPGHVKLLLAAALLLFVLPLQAFALSDADYKRFSSESPAFAAADKRLVQVWEKLRKALPKKDYEALLIDQRDWLQRRRDAEATAEKDAPGLAAAYAAVTERRAAFLEAALPQKAEGKPALPAGAGAKPDAPAPAGENAKQPGGSPAVQKLTPVTALPHDKDGTTAPPAAQASADDPLAPAPGALPAGQAAAPGVADPALAPGPAEFEGSYIMEDGELTVRSAPGGYDVVVERRGPGKSWTCKASGRARLEEASLVLHDKDHPEAAPITIQIESNKMLITRSFPAFCAPGGTLGGVYVKTPVK